MKQAPAHGAGACSISTKRPIDLFIAFPVIAQNDIVLAMIDGKAIVVKRQPGIVSGRLTTRAVEIDHNALHSDQKAVMGIARKVVFCAQNQ